MADALTVRPQLSRAATGPYDPLQVHPAVFSPAQCRRIVALGTSLPIDDAALEGDGGVATSDAQLRLARTAWIAPGDDTEWIYRKLAAVAQRANRRYRFDLTGFDEDLQFTCYDQPGAFYTWHQDGLDGTVGHRKLSLVVQLSDPGDYRGGELELFALRGGSPTPESPSDATLAMGTVLVFPSFEFHRVREIHSGVRYSLVAWVSGPPFR